MSRLIEAGKILDNLSGMLKNMDDYDAVKKVINEYANRLRCGCGCEAVG